MKKAAFTRRRALSAFGSLAAATPLEGQKLIGEPPGRIAPREELVNVQEFEDVARRKLSASAFASIAGGDRKAFDRITFRPRMMVNTMELDLTTELFGQKMFAPILVGPAARQQDFHPEGEVAMARGASAANAVMIVSEDSSLPIEKIAAESKTSLWYQVYPGPDVNAVRDRIKKAVEAGCKAVCITVGTPKRGADWSAIDQLRHGIVVPVLLKGIMSPQEAKIAVERGAQGVVVSNYGGLLVPGMASTIELLPAIAEAAGSKVPVLIDGSFRRGSDILKALALGAQAVLVARPALWGLAAYGAGGVQSVLELLQTELARDMAMCGKVNVKSIDRGVVKIHEW